MLRFGLPIIVFVFLIAPSVTAQNDSPICLSDSGTVWIDTYTSDVLGRDESYTLYLPPDWCHQTNLPLLVLLHGAGGDHTSWIEGGQVDQVAEDLIHTGEIKPLIILMPDGENGSYMQGPHGDYETYIVFELIDRVDAVFPTAATREQRFIGGFSMGGFGALYLGLRHPDRFSAIGGHSPAIPRQQDMTFLEDSLSGETPEPPADHDPVSQIARDGWPENVRLFIDVGDQDMLIRGSLTRLNAELIRQQVAYESHIWPGAHNWDYWRAHIPDYLRFYVGS